MEIVQAVPPRGERVLGYILDGDKLLQVVAERLQQCIRVEDTVARWAGNEFVVLLGEMTRAGDAVLQRRRSPMLSPSRWLVDGHEIVPSTSIGISVYPDDGEIGDDLLKEADIAMYRAKETGRGSYFFFAAARAS